MEFHAVVLCGAGHSLGPFSKVRSTGQTKALLPVANRPMIEYVLEWCEKAFFPRITVVCDSESKEEIEFALGNYKKNKQSKEAADEDTEPANKALDNGSAYIDVIALDNKSTGEIFQYIVKKEISAPYLHFAVLPCDFITDLPPQVLIEAYRNKEDSDVGMLVHYRNSLDIEDKKSKIFPKNYTVYSDIDDGNCRLLDIYTTEDLDFHKSLQLRVQMSWRYPSAVISSKLLNSSIFFGSLIDISKILNEEPERFSDSYFSGRSLTKVVRDLARRSWRHSEMKSTVAFNIVPNCAQFFRINNLQVWMEANRYFMKLQAMKRGQAQQTSKDKVSANVGADSTVGENTSLGEKTNVKRTIIGSGCSIGKRVKLTGSLVLDNVIIEDDVQLENCIIGRGVTIRSKSKLINCNVESSFEVVKGTQSKGDTLLSLTLEGLEEEISFDESSETDSDEESESDFSDEDIDDGYVSNSDGLFAY
ncbi:Piso0_002371 [Millerozyma farinosa CBS 7064]|uniref:Translation initiation factor eIF2B subunit gamma n=1 Tax=Pichia sorbitophila (strain ATCC MYA-4447 / BCRC 22081 / CBS 7064 / NBRC 10061 / NRRL Y-12695) TaxID=559304 RepID=G8YEV7_PICSO|nr:Piso0_002371 [Millerozyma farinosa CBS 7064]